MMLIQQYNDKCLTTLSQKENQKEDKDRERHKREIRREGEKGNGGREGGRKEVWILVFPKFTGVFQLST